MNETDWFSCMTVPVRLGVYKTRHRGSDGRTYEGYSNWLGMLWTHKFDTFAAASRASYPSAQQSREWKGIYRD